MKKVIVIVLVLALGLTAEVANADFTFGTPTNLGPTINSSYNEAVPGISGDGLSLYFTSNRPGGYGNRDIWVTTRATKDDDWGTPVNLGPTVNSPSSEVSPSISADGLTLYFDDFGGPRPGGVGGVDIWVTTRPTISDPWGIPVNLGSTFNSGALDGGPSISADGLALFLYSTRSGGYGSNDIWVARRPTTSDPWGTPVNLGPTVNTSSGDCCPSISADGRMLFCGSGRSGGVGSLDLWVATRPTASDLWGEPVNLGPTVNSPSDDDSVSISTDGSTIFFMSDRPGGVGNLDLWQAPIIPIVDFNGDEFVDTEDLLIMIDNWGTDEPMCDIGPMPWGDGVVDGADLEVLMSYWGQEILPVELVAYWKLDEAEGDIAYDIAGNNDATVVGPVWQPTGGKVNGALESDGIDDYVITPFILNPAEGPFSVFAWVNGSIPGQAVISQADGVDWLSADSSEGKLMTSLSPPAGRFVPPPLVSESVITDGQWHRIGFVWDGSNRILYVDDIEVANDTQAHLAGSTGGLYIGAGKGLEAGSFWTGLIDDVRIYNRVVTP
jgi:Tol biopolymer transport system component